LLLDEILQSGYSLINYVVVIVVGWPPYIAPRPLQTHPFVPERNSSSLPASRFSPLTDIIIKWAQPPLVLLVSRGRCPRMSLSMTLGHVLLLEMSGLFSVWLQTKRNRCLGLRRHEGLEEWDGSDKFSRSQSVFIAGGGGLSTTLG